MLQQPAVTPVMPAALAVDMSTVTWQRHCQAPALPGNVTSVVQQLPITPLSCGAGAVGGFVQPRAGQRLVWLGLISRQFSVIHACLPMQLSGSCAATVAALKSATCKCVAMSGVCKHTAAPPQMHTQLSDLLSIAVSLLGFTPNRMPPLSPRWRAGSTGLMIPWTQHHLSGQFVVQLVAMARRGGPCDCMRGSEFVTHGCG